MIKALLRLVAVALVANATWHIFTAYTAHYRFKDAVENVAQFGGQQSDRQLEDRVLEVAGQYDIPITAASFTVRRAATHTIIDGSYTKPVELLPGTLYPWPFSWHVDTFVTRVAAPADVPKLAPEE